MMSKIIKHRKYGRKWSTNQEKIQLQNHLHKSNLQIRTKSNHTENISLLYVERWVVIIQNSKSLKGNTIRLTVDRSPEAIPDLSLMYAWH